MKIGREAKNFDFLNAHRLSLDFQEIVAFRGHPQTLVFPYSHLLGESRHAVVALPVHAMTHRDFPFNEETEMFLRDFSPIVKDAVILNFSEKLMVIEEFLFSGDDIFQERLPFLNHFKIKSAKELWDIIKKLGITKDEIQSRLVQADISDNLGDFFLLFKTDWLAKFNRHKISYNNPFLEGVSAFLCHPYLHPDAVNWLKDRGVKYIGHDLPSFENPLMYAVGGIVSDLVNKARVMADEYLKSLNTQWSINKRIFGSIFNVYKEGEEAPVYIKLIDLSKLERPVETTLRGRVAVIPIPPLSDPVGVACEVYFSE